VFALRTGVRKPSRDRGAGEKKIRVVKAMANHLMGEGNKTRRLASRTGALGEEREGPAGNDELLVRGKLRKPGE